MIALLRDNFIEIAHAWRNTSEKHLELPLVANWQGTRIYDASCGWGRLWRTFYQLCRLLLLSDFGTQTLHQALQRTVAIFQQQLPLIELHLRQYMSYLKLASKGYGVQEETFMASRMLISEWSSSTFSLIKIIISSRDPRLLKLFKNANFQYPFMNQLRDCQKIVRLEGEMAAALPLAIFKKILQEKPLNELECKQLHKWIGKVNKRPLSVKTLHEGLCAFAAIYQKQALNPARLELFLEEHGCRTFQQADRRSLLWQRQLKKGARIALSSETELVLSSEILPKRVKQHDAQRVFDIENTPKHVMVAAKNQALLRMHSCRAHSTAECGIDTAALHWISADGRLAMMDKLKELNSYTWKSDDQSLHTADLPIVHAVGKILAGFVAQNFVPSHFSYSTVLFDQNYRLKALKPMVRSSFDFDLLEEFILHFSSNRPLIFRKLMQVSGLAAHPVAKFYREAARLSFKADGLELEDLAGIYKIGSSKIVDRAKELNVRLKHDINALWFKYSCSFPDDPHLELMKNKIGDLVVDLHLATGAAGIANYQIDPHTAHKIFDKIDIKPY
jgi:hypothetical protein